MKSLLGFAGLALLSILPDGLLAQGIGSLTGTVIDPSGTPVPNAAVSIVNEATHATTNATTSSGVYVASNLPPGIYDVSVTASGFKEFKQTGVTISVATTNTLNVPLVLLCHKT